MLISSAAALLSLSLATPAAAQNCWNGAAVKAAKVRDLQTLLMVGALQCRATQYDVLGHYNRFVKAHRTTISAHNDVLKTHFVRAGKARDYDRFTTAMANGHSAGAANPEFCKETAALAEQVSGLGRAEVEAIADRLFVSPKGVGRTCS
ncbi:hypothetical protein [uncultured Sphingosinicella sp.]|jgi:hypothetical protein|uniref:hypothetical protein n=1 Tax=uncultured Sphingosinicella sp. TaxID=478748 RepID=UPI0030DD4ADC|tara:strand:- start:26948 stop:27394 length:447 start_codon:yes stop_codon:yes gene_type:complete